MNIIERDKIYARKVYEAYVGTESLKEYAEEIKRISNESGISEKYLRSLLEEYEQTATEEEKEIIKIVKARKAKRVYIEFVENIICLNDEEIKEQIMSKKLKKSEIDKRFKDYLEKIKDQEKLEKAQKVYDYITSVYDEITNENKKKTEKEEHDRVIELFNKIVDEGYITVKAFARDNYSKYGMGKTQFIENLNRLKKYLEERNEYKYYEERLNANRLFAYEKLKSKIKRMLEELPDNYEKVSCENSYDIIDYYLEIGMNPNTFIELCEGNINEQELTRIKHFFRYYTNHEKYPDVQISTINIMGQHISGQTKTELLDLMKNYKIPSKYFYICCKKYVLGQLDEYMKEKTASTR